MLTTVFPPPTDFIITHTSFYTLHRLCNRWVTSEQALANNASYLKAFSAVCFLTVRDITRIHTNKKAVALVQSAWGGTRIEASL